MSNPYSNVMRDRCPDNLCRRIVNSVLRVTRKFHAHFLDVARFSTTVSRGHEFLLHSARSASHPAHAFEQARTPNSGVALPLRSSGQGSACAGRPTTCARPANRWFAQIAYASFDSTGPCDRNRINKGFAKACFAREPSALTNTVGPFALEIHRCSPINQLWSN